MIELKKVVDQKDIEIKILNDQLRKQNIKTSNTVISNDKEEEAVEDTVEAAATYTIKCRECDFVGRSQN